MSTSYAQLTPEQKAEYHQAELKKSAERIRAKPRHERFMGIHICVANKIPPDDCVYVVDDEDRALYARSKQESDDAPEGAILSTGVPYWDE